MDCNLSEYSHATRMEFGCDTEIILQSNSNYLMKIIVQKYHILLSKSIFMIFPLEVAQ